MEKRDARLFQPNNNTDNGNWNIVELDSHRLLRQNIQELIRLTQNSSLTTSELSQRIHHNVETSGKRFATHLVHSLQHEDIQERQAIVWLLTLLNDPETIPQLQAMSRNTRLPRTIRLSASLALSGMGATVETYRRPERRHLHAI